MESSRQTNLLNEISFTYNFDHVVIYIICKFHRLAQLKQKYLFTQQSPIQQLPGEHGPHCFFSTIRSCLHLRSFFQAMTGERYFTGNIMTKKSPCHPHSHTHWTRQYNCLLVAWAASSRSATIALLIICLFVHLAPDLAILFVCVC